MNLHLNLHSEKIQQHRVSAPCTGEVAKALGKCKLEESLPPGLAVKFISYQEAPNKPARSLPDDENVVRGAILNFTVGLDSVLQRVQQQDSVLKELARDRMQPVISKFSARLCGSERDEGKECFGVRRQLEQAPAMAEAAKAALVAVGGGWTVHDLAACLDKNFENRNASQHHNTNEQLSKDMQRLRKAGFADLLDEEMPLECLVIRHYEVFMQLLQ